MWPLLANWRLHWQLQLINLSFIASRNYTPNLEYCLQSTQHCCNHKNINWKSDCGEGWRRQQRRLPRAANTLAPSRRHCGVLVNFSLWTRVPSFGALVLSDLLNSGLRNLALRKNSDIVLSYVAKVIYSTVCA